MRLLRSLTLFLVLLFVAVTAAWDWIAARADDAALEEQMGTNLMLVARSLALTLDAVERTAGPAEVDRLIEAHNKEGTPRVRRLLPPEAPAPVQAAVASGGDARELRVTLDGRMRAYRRLGSGPALLEVSTAVRRLEDKRRQNLLRTVEKSALVGALGALFAWLGGLRLVGRPVDRLIAQARRIAAGDLSRTPVVGDSELAELQRELNVTCERLEDARGRVRAETEARVAALEQLRHADRLKTVGQLAAGVAHELGTPLNVVAGHAKLIASAPGVPAEAAGDARVIGEQAARMTAIIRQLLDFARRGHPRLGRVELGQVVESTVALLRHYRTTAPIELVAETPEAPLWAEVDEGQLQQALTNLVVNAMQAMPAGGPVRVELSAVERDGRKLARIAVVDRGKGMPPEVRERAFEPFFTTKAVGEGTGLGLSVAWGIVEDHGGLLEIDSEPGRGTVATVLLPRVEAA